ncbi:rho GTPase-activating protein 40 [Gastrophryne carolinensis]
MEVTGTSLFPITRIPRPQVLLSRHLFTQTSSLRSCPCNMSQPQDDNSSSRKNSDPLSMKDFWQEVESIKQMRGCDGEECSSSEPSTPEEGEAEADWLQDTGLSPLIKDLNPAENNVLILSTLTRTQTATVQRRLDSYKRSLRKRCKQPTRDVRDVFSTDNFLEENGVDDQSGAEDETIANGHSPTIHPKLLGTHSTECDVFNTEAPYSDQAVMGQNEDCRTGWKPESLPHFRLQKGRLGMTRVSDLSLSDMKQVPALSLIELTALCDILELDLKRNKAIKRRACESRLFGVALATLLEQDRKLISNTQVPLILQAMFTCLEKKGLEIQGILRISGSQTRIKSLQQRLERNFYAGLFSWDEINPHDVAGLLKLFLRELPAPLLTAEYLPAFTAVQKMSNLKQKLQALNLLILILPQANRCTLKALLEFLSKVASQEKSNLMSLWNIATIMAPNLFLYRGSKCPEGGEKQLAEGVAGLVMAMVHYQDLLWTVPAFLLSQVRKLNENSTKKFNDKLRLNFLRKAHTDKEKQVKNQAEPSKQVKIRASLFVKDSMDVRLDESTQAADVLKKFQERAAQKSWQMISTVGLMKCNGFTFPNMELYEVGGNICEHCLDPDTYLLDLYNANPNGEWIIKPSPPPTPIL